MGYDTSIDNSPIMRVVAVDSSGQPVYSSNLIPPVTINYGTPNTQPTNTSGTLTINSTAQTSVDGNAQSLIDGIIVVMNGNGSFAGLTMQNKNAGGLASTDLVFNNDVTTDKFNGPFFDIGFTSSNGNNPSYPVLPIGAYIFTTSDHIGYGTLANKDHIFHTNGAATTNEHLRVTGGGVVKVSNGPFQTATKTALATSGTVALDSTLGNLFTIVPSNTATINVATVPTGQTITLIVTTSGTSSFVVTFGTNFKSTGTLTTGTVSAKVFVLTFISDGTNFNEVSRTTAM